MSGHTRPLIEFWEKTWRAHAEKVAVVDTDGRPWTFGDIEREAQSLANSIPAAPGPPLPIALHLSNGARWLAHYIAILRRGQVLLPIDDQHQRKNARQLASRLGAAIFISEAGAETLDSPRAAPAEAHLIKLTSATTGEPNALFFGEAEMQADASQIITGMGLRPTDRHLVAIPLGHSYALGNLVLPWLIQGATLVCTESPWPQALHSAISQHAVTVLPLVPPLIRSLCEGPRLPDSVRLVISAGGALSSEVARTFRARHRLHVHNFYGASETGGIVFDSDGEATTTGRSAGRALPGVSVKVDEDGAITVSSAAVMRPCPGVGESASFTVADEGKLNDEGELILRGRRDDVVKIGGRRIALNEVENALRALPGVDDAVVLVRSDPRGEPRLAAVLATAEPRDRLQSLARAQLPPWKCPRIWRVCRQLPFNARGKIDRAAVSGMLDAPD